MTYFWREQYQLICISKPTFCRHFRNCKEGLYEYTKNFFFGGGGGEGGNQHNQT